MFVGLKTGLNDAFIISKDIYENFINTSYIYDELVKPYGVGRNLSRYGEPIIENYLIVIPSKWTNSKGEFENEISAWNWLQNKFPLIANHLKPFESKARKRTDKGNYWWELRACDYYTEFEKPKIVYPEIATEGRFTIDNKNSYFDMTSFIIGNDSYELLGILNSKLISFIFSQISSEIRGGFLRWKKQYVNNLPIPKKIKNYNLEKTVHSSIKIKKEFTSLEGKLNNYLASKFQLEKLTKKLQNWQELAFGDFIKELNKAIKTSNKQRLKDNLQEVPELTKKDEFEWLDLFEENKQKAQTLQTQITQTDKEIDAMVYELYGLTEDEIAIVENS